MVSRVRAIAESNIGVMGHIGLTPQSATKLGGFRAQGRTADAALEAVRRRARAAGRRLLRDRARGRARRRSRRGSPRRSTIPTIGIGAGAGCDGQVLVWHDLLGLYAGQTPRFVKRYAELADEIATRSRPTSPTCASGAFPEEQHTYSIPDDELEQFEAALDERALDEQEHAAEQRPRARPRPAARAQRPAVDGADADHEQARSTRRGTRARATANTSPPAPRVGAAARGRASSPKSASFTGQRTSESATGTAAKASTWRLRR